MIAAALLISLLPQVASAQDGFHVELVGELVSGRPGETVGAFTGSGCPHGEVGDPPDTEFVQSTVAVSFPFIAPFGLLAGIAEPDLDGDFGPADLVVPLEATPGEYPLEVSCRNPADAGSASLGTLEVLPPLTVPQDPTGTLTPSQVDAEPGETLTFTAPVDTPGFGFDPADPFFFSGHDITLVLYPGAVQIGSATAPVTSGRDTFELTIEAPELPGQYQLVAFGKVEFIGLVGTMGVSFVADIDIAEDGPADPADPGEVEDLLDTISELGLPQGTERSLSAPLQAVIEQLTLGKDEQACGPLGAFLNQVAAREGRQLTTEEAGELQRATDGLRDALGCDT